MESGEVEANKSITAKEQLKRINDILDEPHLLIGGLAVQFYYFPRDSWDIDLVCTIPVAKKIIEDLYPTNEWESTDKNEDDGRPDILITHRNKGREYGEIKFGPKIIEYPRYKKINWNILKENSVNFTYKTETYEKILVPNAAYLAFTKIMSFISRSEKSPQKALQDLKDFMNLSNQRAFSMFDFVNIIKSTKADEEIISEFLNKVKEKEEYITAVKSSSLHELLSIFFGGSVENIFSTNIRKSDDSCECEQQYSIFPDFMGEHFRSRLEFVQRFAISPYENEITTTELYQLLLEIYLSSHVKKVRIIDAVPKRWEEIVSENSSLNYGTETLKIISRRISRNLKTDFRRVFIINNDIENEIKKYSELTVKSRKQKLNSDIFLKALSIINEKELKIAASIKRGIGKRAYSLNGSKFMNRYVFLSDISGDDSVMNLFNELGDIVVINDGEMVCAETKCNGNNYDMNVITTSASKIYINYKDIRSDEGRIYSEKINEFFKIIESKKMIMTFDTLLSNGIHRKK